LLAQVALTRFSRQKIQHARSAPVSRSSGRLFPKGPGELFSSPGLWIFVECFGFLLQRLSLPVGSRRSAGPTEISELGGVADLGDEPGLRPKINRGLLLDDSADWHRAKHYGVTSLCHGDVILSSVLAEEKPFFTLEQTR
jgi:hypothetical protein